MKKIFTIATIARGESKAVKIQSFRLNVEREVARGERFAADSRDEFLARAKKARAQLPEDFPNVLVGRVRA